MNACRKLCASSSTFASTFSLPFSSSDMNVAKAVLLINTKCDLCKGRKVLGGVERCAEKFTFYSGGEEMKGKGEGGMEGGREGGRK